MMMMMTKTMALLVPPPYVFNACNQFCKFMKKTINFRYHIDDRMVFMYITLQTYGNND